MISNDCPSITSSDKTFSASISRAAWTASSWAASNEGTKLLPDLLRRHPAFGRGSNTWACRLHPIFGIEPTGRRSVPAARTACGEKKSPPGRRVDRENVHEVNAEPRSVDLVPVDHPLHSNVAGLTLTPSKVWSLRYGIPKDVCALAVEKMAAWLRDNPATPPQTNAHHGRMANESGFSEKVLLKDIDDFRKKGNACEHTGTTPPAPNVVASPSSDEAFPCPSTTSTAYFGSVHSSLLVTEGAYVLGLSFIGDNGVPGLFAIDETGFLIEDGGAEHGFLRKSNRADSSYGRCASATPYVRETAAPLPPWPGGTR